MLGEELRQVRLGWEEQDRRVTSIHHMSTKGSALFDQPAKVGVKFRSPTRDIDCRNISFLEGLDALLCRFSGHTFGPIGPGIDMAVPAGLIAELADIDLKDCDSCGAKGGQADPIELSLERRPARCLPKHLQLLRRGGKGVLSSQ